MINYLIQIYFPIFDFQEKILLQGEEQKVLAEETCPKRIKKMIDNNQKIQSLFKQFNDRNKIIEVSSCDESSESLTLSDDDKSQHYRDNVLDLS